MISYGNEFDDVPNYANEFEDYTDEFEDVQPQAAKSPSAWDTLKSFLPSPQTIADPLNIKESNLPESFERGVRQSIGAIPAGNYPSYEQRQAWAQENRGVLNRAVEQISMVGADLPIIAPFAQGGASLGSAVPGLGTAAGTVVGGTAGTAVALGIRELYNTYQEQVAGMPNKPDFASWYGGLQGFDQLSTLAKVGANSLTQAMLFELTGGAGRGASSGLQSKGFNQAAQKAGQIGAETGVLTGAELAQHGEVSPEQVASNLLTVTGLNLTHSQSKQIADKAAQEGKTPQEFWNEREIIEIKEAQDSVPPALKEPVTQYFIDQKSADSTIRELESPLTRKENEILDGFLKLSEEIKAASREEVNKVSAETAVTVEKTRNQLEKVKNNLGTLDEYIAEMADKHLAKIEKEEQSKLSYIQRDENIARNELLRNEEREIDKHDEKLLHNLEIYEQEYRAKVDAINTEYDAKVDKIEGKELKTKHPDEYLAKQKKNKDIVKQINARRKAALQQAKESRDSKADKAEARAKVNTDVTRQRFNDKRDRLEGINEVKRAGVGRTTSDYLTQSEEALRSLRTELESKYKQSINELKQELKKKEERGLKRKMSKMSQVEKALADLNSKTDAKIAEIKEKTNAKGGSSPQEQVTEASPIEKAKGLMNAVVRDASTPKQTYKRMAQAVQQQIFNFLAPLEAYEQMQGINPSESVVSRIKLAQASSSEINSVLENGLFSNQDGRFIHEGLKGAYTDVGWKYISNGKDYSLEEINSYRTSKIAIRRAAEGKETGIDIEKAKDTVRKLHAKYEPIDARIRDFQKAVLNHYGKDLIGKSMTEQWNSQYYSPMYRVMDNGQDSILTQGSLKPKQPFYKFEGSKKKVIPPSESDPFNAAMLIQNDNKNKAILAYRNLVEKGQMPGEIKVGKPREMPKEIMEEIGIDPEMIELASQLYDQTRKNSFTPEQNVLKGWKEGVPFEVTVPEDVYEIFSLTNPQQYGVIPEILNRTNKWFSRGISTEPFKFLSITARDAMSAFILSKNDGKILDVPRVLSEVWGNSEPFQRFLALGGDLYAERMSTRLDRARKVDDLVTPGHTGVMVPISELSRFLRKGARKFYNLSLAVPYAEYKRGLEKYGDTEDGRIAAALDARKVTYDPTVKGKSKIMRELNNYIPFWNVSVQDLHYITQNLDNPKAYAKGIMALTIPTIMLKFANENNPDYQALTPEDKAGFWHLFYEDNHVRVPIPWLLGSIFKVAPEALFDTVFYNLDTEPGKKANPRMQEAWSGLYASLADNISGAVPPLLQTFVNLTAGVNLPSPVGTLLGVESKAPEVIPRRLQDLPPRYQYTPNTSQLARQFGWTFDVSPILVDKTLTNTFGLNARDVLRLTDSIAYATGLAEDKRPESNYLLIGNFVTSSTPTYTKYQHDFYDYLNEATQQKNAEKLVEKYGITDSRLDDLQYKGVNIFAYNRKIGNRYRQIRDIENSDDSPQSKKKEIKELQKEINEFYKEAVEIFRLAQKD